MDVIKIVLLLSLFWTYCFSQEQPKDIPDPIKLKEISLLGGFNSSAQSYMTNEQLNKIWPGFSDKSYANFQTEKIGTTSARPNIIAGAYFYFDNYKKKNSGYKIRQQHVVGITYSRETKLSSHFHHANFARIDTLYSSANTPPLYRDNVYVDSYSLNYINNNAGIDLQELFSSNPEKTFSVYGGIGASVNYSYSSKIMETEQAYGGENITANPNFNYDSINSPKLSDAYFHPRRHRHTFSAHNAMTYKVYIPIGLNIRLSETHPFFSRVSFIAQARAGYNFMKVPSINVFTNFSTNFLFGIKYSLH